ncbi:MAG: prefoldin subunit [Candidatus Marsarchaeota archaeon]|jgi:Prefoldin, chaperonin cofactor|nr:prefoldin subunit [Candidatus Marsarchaeota archaeon]
MFRIVISFSISSDSLSSRGSPLTFITAHAVTITRTLLTLIKISEDQRDVMAAQQDQTDQAEIEKMIREYQMLQEQLRNAAVQLDQFQSAKADLSRAQEELGKASGKIYLTIGGVIVETSKEKALNDVKERAELTEIRIGSANKQFAELRAREKQLGEKLSQAYQQGRAKPGGA